MRDSLRPDSRRTLARGVALLVITALLAPTAVSAITYEPSDFRTGTVEEPADGVTVISVQGFHWQGYGSEKKPARLLGVSPDGDLDWIHNGTESVGANWFYDVDPLDDGNLLVVATNENGTLVYELDPPNDVVWVERFDIKDTHDVDLINDDQLLVANMRAYNETTARSDEGVFIYDRGREEIVWRWYFRDHYPASGGGDYMGDWTHVNDVDKIGPGRYLVSPRNFDQVIVVNRSTGEIDLRLGEDGDHETLYEQHNPQYLESTDGHPTILVADSENSRIVEYERRDGDWVRTWELSGGLTWPRDADRLPNGNTVIVDSLNHRVIEVTPRGEIVWEVYAPWGTYDAERVHLGDEPGGPTIADQGAEGEHRLTGSAGLEPGARGETVAQRLSRVTTGTPVEAEVQWMAGRWDHVTPWITPVWMGGWAFVGVVLAGLVAIGWVTAEIVIARGRIARRLRRFAP